ncbi:MAG: DUF427 domain-containing protein [Gammaproteobacteria bacterium]
MKAIWQDTVIANSDRTEVVEGNHYFPPEDVAEQYLVKSDTTSVCPWKGTAHYYSIVIGNETNADAAWYYPDTKDAANNIRGRIAFWKGVQVEG